MQNALSELFSLEIWRAGAAWQQEYSKGIPLAPLKKTGKAGRKTGTKITFRADSTIMQATEFNYDTLAQRLRELAFLNKGLKITLTDERVEEEKSHQFLYTGGVAEFITHLNRGKSVLHESPIHFEGSRDLPTGGTLEMEVALQYNDKYNENIFSFANNINTVDGGAHLSGFRSALTRTINAYGQHAKLFKDLKENLSGDDVREGDDVLPHDSMVTSDLEQPSLRADADEGVAVRQTMCTGDAYRHSGCCGCRRGVLAYPRERAYCRLATIEGAVWAQ